MMKAKSSQQVLNLLDIPNVGPATLQDLKRMGIHTPQALKHADGMALYQQLCTMTGKVHDPCMADIFLAAIDFLNGGSVKHWSHFTVQRKRILKRSSLG